MVSCLHKLSAPAVVMLRKLATGYCSSSSGLDVCVEDRCMQTCFDCILGEPSIVSKALQQV